MWSFGIRHRLHLRHRSQWYQECPFKNRQTPWHPYNRYIDHSKYGPDISLGICQFFTATLLVKSVIRLMPKARDLITFPLHRQHFFEISFSTVALSFLTTLSMFFRLSLKIIPKTSSKHTRQVFQFSPFYQAFKRSGSFSRSEILIFNFPKWQSRKRYSLHPLDGFVFTGNHSSPGKPGSCSASVQGGLNSGKRITIVIYGVVNRFVVINADALIYFSSLWGLRASGRLDQSLAFYFRHHFFDISSFGPSC